jgi:RNase P/RNase MRP subunit p29
MNKNQQEFIGKQLTITKSKNKEQENITGKIIDETKNTFTIRIQTEKKENKNKTIKILKSGKEFRINNQKINGNKITKRPDERIKIKEN